LVDDRPAFAAISVLEWLDTVCWAYDSCAVSVDENPDCEFVFSLLNIDCAEDLTSLLSSILDNAEDIFGDPDADQYVTILFAHANRVSFRIDLTFDSGLFVVTNAHIM
jgi:hypothetical protein